MSDVIRNWTDITPEEARGDTDGRNGIDLSKDLTITAPLNEEGERCPWPWEPQQLVGAPLGQYRCPYCGAMVVAGIPHLDYTPQQITLTPANGDEVIDFTGGHYVGEDGTIAFEQPMTEGTQYVHPGDTVHQDGYGVLTVHRFTVESP
jgi:hypothetical protein